MAKVCRDERCALCGKSRDQVKEFLVGVNGGVCADCVELCSHLLKDKADAEASRRNAEPLRSGEKEG